MNKLIPTLLLLATPIAFSGCIFGKKAHHTPAAQVHTDPITVTRPLTDTNKIAVAIPAHISDSTTLNKKQDTAAVAARDTTKTTIQPDSATVAANVRYQHLLSQVSAVWHRPLTYTTFDGKAKMHYEGNGSGQDLSANFRIKKDSVIWVLVSALGGMLPVARAYITPDSIKVVNYLSKEVLLMPISQANNLLPAPVDFSILQNLITGQPLLTNGKITGATDSSMAWIMQIIDGGYGQQLTYAKADTTLQTQQLGTSQPNGPKVSIQHSSYTSADGRPFSRSRTVQINNNGSMYELDMDFTSSAFDRPVDVPFSYSKNYRVNPSR